VGDCYSHTSNKVTNLTLVRYLFYPYIARKLVVCLVALMVSNLTSKSPPSYRRILVTCCEDSNARCGNIYSSTNVGAFFFFFFKFSFSFYESTSSMCSGGGREREREKGGGVGLFYAISWRCALWKACQRMEEEGIFS
jgi:hypothetical protein